MIRSPKRSCGEDADSGATERRAVLRPNPALTSARGYWPRGAGDGAAPLPTVGQRDGAMSPERDQTGIEMIQLCGWVSFELTVTVQVDPSVAISCEVSVTVWVWPPPEAE